MRAATALRNAFGWGATTDIDAAVAWLQRRPDVQQGRIGGIGFSVGGEQMLEAAAENTGLRAVVAEGAGERSVHEALMRGPRGWFSLPTAAVQTAALSVLSDTMPPPSLEDVAARIAPRPIFLIYAGRGAGGEDLNPAFYRAAKQPKSDLGDPRVTPRRRAQRPSDRVRTQGDRLLRRRAPRLPGGLRGEPVTPVFAAWPDHNSASRVRFRPPHQRTFGAPPCGFFLRPTGVDSTYSRPVLAARGKLRTTGMGVKAAGLPWSEIAAVFVGSSRHLRSD